MRPGQASHKTNSYITGSVQFVYFSGSNSASNSASVSAYFPFFLKFSNFQVRYVLGNSRVKLSQACYQCHLCGNFYSLTFDSAINANFAEIFTINILYTVILGCNKLGYNEQKKPKKTENCHF